MRRARWMRRTRGSKCRRATWRGYSNPFFSDSRKGEAAIVSAKRSSILKLIAQTDAAARIVVRRRALNRGGSVSQSGLQLKMLGQVHIRFELTGAGAALLGFEVDALGNIAPGGNAGPGVGPGRGGAAGTEAEAVQSQASLNSDERIEAAVSAHAAEGSERGAHLRQLQGRELLSGCAEQQQRHDFILRLGRVARELELRRIRQPGDVQDSGGVGDSRLRREIERGIDLVLDPGAVEAHASRREIQSARGQLECAALKLEFAGHDGR